MANKTIFGITAVAAFVTTSALAADMAVKSPPPRAPVPVTSNWTGCYVNGGAGYGFFRQEQHFSDIVEVDEDATAGGSGWLGTVGGGCDYQFSPGSGWGSFVVGAFADYDFMDLQVSLDGVPLTGQFNHESKTAQTITTSLVWKFL